MPGIVLRVGHDRFLPNLFQFICHPTIELYKGQLLTASQNNPPPNKHQKVSYFAQRVYCILLVKTNHLEGSSNYVYHLV
jgi:hypothetical protein